jgi:hypothetical protein
MDFMQHVDQGLGPAWRGVLFRQTYPQLEEVRVKTKRWFHEAISEARWNESRSKWIFPGGEELLLRHMATAEDYRLRYVFADNTPGDWTQIFTETVIGVSAPPPDVADFRVIDTRAGRRLIWLYPDVPRDFKDFVIRHRTGLLAQWDGAEPLPSNQILANEADIANIPRGVRTFMIRARDVAGNLSAKAAFATVDLGEAPIANIVLQENFADDNWPGTLAGGTVVAGELRADDDGGLYLQNDDAPYLPDDGTGGAADALYLPVQYQEMTYTQVFASPGDAVPAQGTIQATGNFEGLELAYRDDGGVLYLPNGADLYLGGAVKNSELYLPMAGEFLPWPDGFTLTRQPYELRLRTPAGNVASAVVSETVTVDVPDRNESFEDLVTATAGTRLPIFSPFRDILRITDVRVQFDGNGGRFFKILDKDTQRGPLVQVLDGSGAPVAGLIDATVQGY